MPYLFADRNREIRFFISSTFQDMMSERELLIKKVFPELRSYCMGRQINLTEVDLRWGITDEESMHGKVIEYCMSEIDKSRPYFLCVIGNRYGWRPTLEEIARNQAIIERYPWVVKDIENKLSITNMEILYGALRKIADRNNAFFYLKKWDVINDVSDDEEICLNRLRNELIDNKEFVVKTYDDTHDLYSSIIEDLKRLIDTEFPSAQAPTNLEKIRLPHITFARLKNSFFIENDYITRSLTAFVDDGGKPFLLASDHGVGLSACLSHFIVDYNSKTPDDYIFLHYSVIDSNQNGVVNILSRLYREINEWLNISSEVPINEEELITGLPELLAAFSDCKCLIVIDDADRILCQEGKNALSWLPQTTPPNVRIILTSHEQEFVDDCLERGFQSFRLNPMNVEETKQYIHRYLGVYCKKLDRTLINQIAFVSWLHKPQLLRSILDELRIFGLHEGIAAQVKHYTSCGSPDAFYSSVLSRYEFDYGDEIVRKVCSLIALSKEGLLENELLELIKFSRFEFTPLLNALSLQLEQYSGNLFFHNKYLNEAVKQRYLSSRSAIDRIRRDIIKYCEKSPYSVTSLRELPNQYRELGMLIKLKSYLSDPLVFCQLARSNIYELALYWQTLKNHYSMKNAFINTYKTAVFEDNSQRLDYMTQAANFLSMNDSHSGALYFYKILLKSSSDHTIKSADLKTMIGAAYRKTSKYKKALRFLQESLDDQITSSNNRSTQIINTYNEIAEIFTVRGEHKQALKHNMTALSHCLRLVGENHRLTAITYREVGWAYEYLGDYQRSQDYLHKAKDIFTNVYGKKHPEIIYCYHALAWVYDWRCNYKEVIKYAGAAYDLSLQYFGMQHSLTGMSYKLIALGKYRAGNYQGALEDNRSALQIFLNLYGEKHTRVSVQYFQIGLALLKLLKFEEASQSFEKSINLDLALIGNDSQGDFAISYNYFGWSLILQGQYTKGLELVEKALETAKKEYGLVSSDAADSYYFIGRTYCLMNNYEKSLEPLAQAVSLREQVLGANHVDTGEAYQALAQTQNRLNLKQEAAASIARADHIFKINEALHLAAPVQFATAAKTKDKINDLYAP